MPELVRGDIFEDNVHEKDNLKLVFGYVGFNEMRVSWSAFSAKHSEFTGITNPFTEIANKPIKLQNNLWFWFILAGDNHGLATADLECTLNEVFDWVIINSVSSVTTNGISNTNHCTETELNRRSDDERAKFIMSYMSKIEDTNKCKVRLISRNDVFVRNKP